MPRQAKPTVFAALQVLVCAALCRAQEKPVPHTGAITPNYLRYVQTFADTLLDKGRDNYGAKRTPLWCSVIDTRDMSVPRSGVVAPLGVREGDRALGGSNLHQDVVTLQVFPVLSAVTGQPRYGVAARDYVASYLENAQNADTGLIAWGEHCYYNVFDDKPAVNEKYSAASYGGMWHELVEWTPPWKALWEVNPAATTRAINGLRFHFFGSKPGPDLLFNRHAYWNQAVHQPIAGSQPWIKHSGLYTYSFSFLGSKTRDPRTLEWARGSGELFWKRRNPQTNLTLSCIDDPRPSAQNASGGLTKLAYWLLKASQSSPSEIEWRGRAVAYLKAYDRYFYVPAKGGYRTLVAPDGQPFDETIVTPWAAAYGSSGLFPFGRIAAYFAKTEKDPEFEQMARRVAQIGLDSPIPENLTPESLAFALNLNLDLFDLTGETSYLQNARRYADLGIEKFWVQNSNGGLLRRQVSDPYYEAKTGAGDLLAGLLRLHLRLHPEIKDPGLYDWSF